MNARASLNERNTDDSTVGSMMMLERGLFFAQTVQHSRTPVQQSTGTGRMDFRIFGTDLRSYQVLKLFY